MSQTIGQHRALKTDYARPLRKRFIHDQIDRTPISRPDTVFSRICRYTVAAAWVAAVATVIMAVKS